ncbi:hypothetical protein QBC35DRAFT_513573 [Podospora australis]|uniref:Epoxide hydrolase n=1 Tax=Podospora australis TaxID=1536484 RepID=A0AAN6WX95_9PEZI|nr:hypothetical protein QBC35DRAFT_513573 [Podospora australis]
MASSKRSSYIDGNGLAPATPDSNNGLSTSISSLSSAISSSRQSNSSSSHITKTYRQASTLFLTRRLPEALSTVLPLITPTPQQGNAAVFDPAPIVKASRSSRIKVWSLYLAILNGILELSSDEGKAAFGTQEWRALCHKVREGEVWEEVVKNGYHGVEGDVDADVVINLATILLAHAKTQILNQKRLENYLAASRTPNLDSVSQSLSSPSSKKPRHQSVTRAEGTGADTPRDLNARVKILELYTLHVLLRNDEWDYAKEFISVSPVLDDERREAFLQALQSLQEESKEAERREEEARKEREEKIKRDIEEARRLRAENEERERKRLEEERVKREKEAAAASKASKKATEGDYGVDSSSSVSSGKSSSSSSLKKPSSSSSAKAGKKVPPGALRKSSVSSATGSGNKVVPTPPATRASMVLANIRGLVEQVSNIFRTNPYLLYRLLAFIIGLVVIFGRRKVRERLRRILGDSWGKLRATAGMGTKIYNLWTPVSVFLQPRAFEAVKGVRDALTTADNALVLVVAETALVTNANESGRPDVGVAVWAFAVALVAETAYGYAGLLAAHDEIAVRRTSMEDVEENTPNKRKASPSPSPSDAPAKRTRLEDGGFAPRGGDHVEDSTQRDRKRSPSPRAATSPATSRRSFANDREFSSRSPELRRQPPPQPAAPPVKKAVSQEEKKRGQRLFGGLLSTLSQKPTSSQNKRRQDIERRQQERAQQQRAEDDKRRTERLAKLKVDRQIEDIRFEYDVMRTRHEHLLSQARYLKTRSRPVIYYLPWEPTREQEDIIKDQIRDAEDRIAEEKAAFQRRKERRLKELGVTDHRDDAMDLDARERKGTTAQKQETVGEPTSPSHSTNPPPPQADHHQCHPSPHPQHHDETGDEMVMQDAEDTMAVDKLTPNDSRVVHHTTTLPTGQTYHYLLAVPSSPPKGTILLVHGFPDLSFGWRYQIPFLVAKGYKVVAPDMIGYGRTSAPQEAGPYSYKSVTADLAALVKEISPAQPIVLGGHDWGGAIVWRFALYYPELLKGVFSVCTPYGPPRAEYAPKKVVIDTVLPNFRYQLQFEDTELETKIMEQGKEGIKKFLNILYGARGEDGKGLFTAAAGVPIDALAGEVEQSRLLSEEELDFYVAEYERNGVHGPMNWYRTWDVNYQEEAEGLVKEGKTSIAVPSMLVAASRDVALPPAMSAGMHKHFEKLTKKEVDSSHWALWEKPAEVNEAVGEFIDSLGKEVKASM